jgi:hypothetical protein
LGGGGEGEGELRDSREKEERGIADDGDDDESAGGRRRSKSEGLRSGTYKVFGISRLPFLFRGINLKLLNGLRR